MVDLLKRMEDLDKKITAGKERYDFLGTLISRREAFCESLSSKHSSAVSTVEMDSKVIEVLKILVEKFSFKGMDFIKDLVTRGLQTIFQDESYSFDIEFLDRGANKTVEFWIIT